MRWPLALSGRGEGREYLPLLCSIFIVATCAIIFELMIGAVSSYLLGDSVYQFSVTIGLFLTAMGMGSFLSRRLFRDLLTTFVNVELIIGLLGGSSVPLLFYVYGTSPGIYRPVMYTVVAVIGTLVGLEIPLVTRLLSDHFVLRTNLANVLFIDYLGGLLGSLLFPLVLLPRLGLVPTSLLIGLLNTGVAYLTIAAYRDRLPQRRAQALLSLATAALLLLAFVQNGSLWGFLEQRLFRDSIIYSAQTSYQQITLTAWRDDVRLFLDGNLQFSSLDEHRYHEALVHPAMSTVRSRARVLILGGGDGLAAREVLKYPDVERVTLVDLDPAIIALSRTNATLARLNGGSLANPKLNVVNVDAFKFIEENDDFYNVILADLPDPRNESLQKLYSVEFYGLAHRRLAADGVMVTQATSPYFAPKAYWSIYETMRATLPRVLAYHADVPSFGDWGFVLGSTVPLSPESMALAVPTRYLDSATLRALFVFGKDMTNPGSLQPNSILQPILLEYYRQGWRGAR